jgi:hypothetical protein
MYCQGSIFWPVKYYAEYWNSHPYPPPDFPPMSGAWEGSGLIIKGCALYSLYFYSSSKQYGTRIAKAAFLACKILRRMIWHPSTLPASHGPADPWHQQPRNETSASNFHVSSIFPQWFLPGEGEDADTTRMKKTRPIIKASSYVFTITSSRKLPSPPSLPSFPVSQFSVYRKLFMFLQSFLISSTKETTTQIQHAFSSQH